MCQSFIVVLALTLTLGAILPFWLSLVDFSELSWMACFFKNITYRYLYMNQYFLPNAGYQYEYYYCSNTLGAEVDIHLYPWALWQTNCLLNFYSYPSFLSEPGSGQLNIFQWRPSIIWKILVFPASLKVQGMSAGNF